MALRSLLPPLLASAVITAGSYAAAAAAPWGPGLSARPGHRVSAVRYETRPEAPGTVVAVRFTLTPVPPSGATVRARVRRGGAWLACRAGGVTVVCPTRPLDLGAVDYLHVDVVG